MDPSKGTDRPAGEDGRISLVVADDHAVVRRGLKAFIETEPDIELLEAADSGRRAVEAAARHSPDVMLLDLLMPDQEAAETVRQVKACSPRTQIVVLTSHEGEEQVVPVTKAGALSYVLKDTTPEQLIDAVRRAKGGQSTLSPRIDRKLLLEITEAGEPAPHGDLTARELEVLRAVAEGFSNRRIAEEFGISEKTVKSHVSNILSKLYLADRTQAAVYAWRRGLVGP
ncbi:MAG: response regulator transcription factor [Acidobacteriota bacterium]